MKEEKSGVIWQLTWWETGLVVLSLVMLVVLVGLFANDGPAEPPLILPEGWTEEAWLEWAAENPGVVEDNNRQMAIMIVTMFGTPMIVGALIALDPINNWSLKLRWRGRAQAVARAKGEEELFKERLYQAYLAWRRER